MAKDNNPKSSENDKQQVATPQALPPANRNVLFVGFFGIVFLVVAYYLYTALQGEDKSKAAIIPIPTNIAKPPVSQDNSGVNIPQLPQVPKLLAPVEAVADVKIVLPPPPPILAQTAAINLPQAIDQKSSDSVARERNLAEEQKAKEGNKRKSAIMAYGGAQNISKEDDKATPKEAKVSDFIDISKTAVSFKGAPEYLLTRGKIIDAIIEVPINSGIGGEIRAIISRDVYSQSGKIILIPKGSRAIGNYSSGVGKPVGVVNVNWERIDLANGYVVKLTKATGVNNLGMLGANGDVDYKIAEQITKTIISSVISIASAVGLDSIVPVPATVTTTTNSALNNTSLIVSAYQTALAVVVVGVNNNVGILTALCNNVLPLLKTFSLTNPVYATYISSLNTCCIPTTIILGEQNSINQFATVMGLINNNGAVSLTDNSAAGKAATQAYTDFSNTLKTITGTQDTATLVTIPQGSVIKMYVGQDIEFPKTAIDRSR